MGGCQFSQNLNVIKWGGGGGKKKKILIYNFSWHAGSQIKWGGAGHNFQNFNNHIPNVYSNGKSIHLTFYLKEKKISRKAKKSSFFNCQNFDKRLSIFMHVVNI